MAGKIKSALLVFLLGCSSAFIGVNASQPVDKFSPEYKEAVKLAGAVLKMDDNIRSVLETSRPNPLPITPILVTSTTSPQPQQSPVIPVQNPASTSVQTQITVNPVFTQPTINQNLDSHQLQHSGQDSFSNADHVNAINTRTGHRRTGEWTWGENNQKYEFDLYKGSGPITLAQYERLPEDLQKKYYDNLGSWDKAGVRDPNLQSFLKPYDFTQAQLTSANSIQAQPQSNPAISEASHSSGPKGISAPVGPSLESFLGTADSKLFNIWEQQPRPQTQPNISITSTIKDGITAYATEYALKTIVQAVAQDIRDFSTWMNSTPEQIEARRQLAAKKEAEYKQNVINPNPREQLQAWCKFDIDPVWMIDALEESTVPESDEVLAARKLIKEGQQTRRDYAQLRRIARQNGRGYLSPSYWSDCNRRNAYENEKMKPGSITQAFINNTPHKEIEKAKQVIQNVREQEEPAIKEARKNRNACYNQDELNLQIKFAFDDPYYTDGFRYVDWSVDSGRSERRELITKVHQARDESKSCNCARLYADAKIIQDAIDKKRLMSVNPAKSAVNTQMSKNFSNVSPKSTGAEYFRNIVQHSAKRNAGKYYPPMRMYYPSSLIRNNMPINMSDTWKALKNYTPSPTTQGYLATACLIIPQIRYVGAVLSALTYLPKLFATEAVGAAGLTAVEAAEIATVQGVTMSAQTAKMIQDGISQGKIAATQEAVRNFVAPLREPYFSVGEKVIKIMQQQSSSAVKQAAANSSNRSSELISPSSIIIEQVGKEIKNVRIDFSKNDLTHIFRNKPGHLLDTPANRELLLDTANDIKNFLGLDKYGNQWYGKILPNGKQSWAVVRDETIRYAGLNDIPKIFNNQTGLSRNLNL